MVASASFFDAGSLIFNSKAVQRGPGMPKLMCKNISKLMCKIIFLKRYVCQHCAALQTSKRTPFFFISIRIIVGNCIFSYLLANVPPRPKVGKRTPPQIWGAVGISASRIRAALAARIREYWSYDNI